MSIYHSRDFDSLFRGLEKAEQDRLKERLKEIRLQLEQERARRARLENHALAIRNENARVILDLKKKLIQDGQIIEAVALTDSQLMMFLAQSRKEIELAKIQAGVQREKDILALERSHLERERELLDEERKLLQDHGRERQRIESGAALVLREAEHQMRIGEDVNSVRVEQLAAVDSNPNIHPDDKPHIKHQINQLANETLENIFS